MKKLIALLMAAVMMLCACSALAAETVEFDESMSISVAVPEGYEMVHGVNDGVLQILLTKDDDSMAVIMAVAADAYFDEAATLNDLSDEDKNILGNALAEDMGEQEWTVMTTGEGTQVMMTETNDEDYDMGIFVSLYNGYDILLYASYEDGRDLTDDDVNFVMQFLTDLDFTTVIPQ